MEYTVDETIHFNKQAKIVDHPVLKTREEGNLEAVAGFDPNQTSAHFTFISMASSSHGNKYFNLVPGDNYPYCYVIEESNKSNLYPRIKLQDDTFYGVRGFYSFSFGDEFKVITMERSKDHWNIIMHSKQKNL